VTTHFTNTLDSKGNTVTDRFDAPITKGGYCLFQDDVLLIEYTDPSDATGSPNTVKDTATFALRTGQLQTDKSVYIIGRDIILTSIDADLDLDSALAETYDIDLIEWDSDAATITMGDAGRNAAEFGPGPIAFTETGDSTGIFQAIVEMPEKLDNDWLERDEEIILLEYTDWGSSNSERVGQTPANANVTIFTSNFGATVELDQKVYSWTDKVLITVVASDHQFDSRYIDAIRVNVSTRSFGLNNYLLLETGSDTGIFTGEIILSGFLHDADGDLYTGANTGFDNNLVTSGRGPTNGFLRSGRDDGIVVMVQSSSGQTAFASAEVQWHVGVMDWLPPSDPSVSSRVVRLIDSDMNLNPLAVDQFSIRVWSDTDPKGIKVTLTETNQNTGIFEATVFYTTINPSTGNHLRVAVGDQVYTRQGQFSVTAFVWKSIESGTAISIPLSQNFVSAAPEPEIAPPPTTSILKIDVPSQDMVVIPTNENLRSTTSNLIR